MTGAGTRRVRRTALLSAAIGLLAASCGAPGEGGGSAASDPSSASASTSETDSSSPSGESSASGSASSGDASANGEPLKVGFITPLSGPLAGPGQDLIDGFQLYLDQNDSTLGGRPVELTVEDTQSTPDTGTQVAKRLVQQVGVDIVVGPLLGNVGLAVGDYMSTTDKTLFYPIPSSDTFLRDLPENMFVSGGTAAQDAHPMGTYALDQGYQRVLTLCQDYAFGHELCGGFVNTFTDGGGEIVDQQWAPLGTADYGPFIADISSQQYDAIYLGLVGADAIKFIKSFNAFGLKDQAPLIASLQPLDQSLVRAMGADADGLVSSGHFAEGRDSEATSAFVTEYEAAYDKIPSYYSASGNLAGQWIDEALRSVNGEIGGATDFLDAVRQVSFDDSVFGPISLDENGNVVDTVYIRKIVDRGDGVFWNVVEDSFEDIGPTYYYDYQAYLDQPVYSREYQGVDWPTDCSVITADDCPIK